MNDYLMKEIGKARAHSRGAYDAAIVLKRSGSLSSVFEDANSGLNQITHFGQQQANKNRYSLFRGWVYSAVNALALSAAKQPVNVGHLRAFDSSKKGEPRSNKDWQLNKMTEWPRNKAAREELELLPSHPLVDVLDRPNPAQNRWEFVYSFTANLCLTGWAFIVRDVGKDGNDEFYSLPTTWITPIHKNGLFSEFKIVDPRNPTAGSGKDELFSRDQVEFAYFPDPSDLRAALAPAAAQSNAIKIDDNIQTSQVHFFNNAFLPSVIITMGSNPHPDVPGGKIRSRLTAAQRRQVHTAIRKVSTGVANYGNPAIIDGLIERIDRLSATQNEMGWEKSEDKVATRILSAFGVHRFILGDVVNVGGYAQVQSIREVFCDRVNTFLDMLSRIMTNFAQKDSEKSQRLLVWWEQCIAIDPQLTQRLYLSARKNKDITQNELRAFMSLPPDVDRNELVVDNLSAPSVINVAAQVSSGQIDKEQGIAILEGMGLSTELSTRISGNRKEEIEEIEEIEEESIQDATQALEMAVSALSFSPKRIASKVVESVNV